MTLARTASTLLLTAWCLSTGFGCTNKVHDENLQFREQNRELQSQLSEREERLKAATDAAQQAAAQKEMADSKLRELQNAPVGGAPATGPGAVGATGGSGTGDGSLAGLDTTVDTKAGTLTVSLPGDVLFDSGMAILKPTSLSTLDKVAAAVKKNYAGKTLRVNGFTDSDPITKTRDKWDDNWDLSYARAKSVTNYLTAHGVDSHMVSIIANGPNKPKSSKSASRRVEIVVATR